MQRATCTSAAANGDSSTGTVGGPNLGQSFIRLRAGAASLDLDAFMTILQDATDPVFDDDLGAASPTILPDGFLVGGGKDGNFYLLDPSKMTQSRHRTSASSEIPGDTGQG